MPPTFDTAQNVPLALDTAHEVSPTLDAAQKVPPTLDTTHKVSPTLDTAQKVSPTLDTAQIVPRALDTARFINTIGFTFVCSCSFVFLIGKTVQPFYRLVWTCGQRDHPSGHILLLTHLPTPRSALSSRALSGLDAMGKPVLLLTGDLDEAGDIPQETCCR